MLVGLMCDEALYQHKRCAKKVHPCYLFRCLSFAFKLVLNDLKYMPPGVLWYVNKRSDCASTILPVERLLDLVWDKLLPIFQNRLFLDLFSSQEQRVVQKGGRDFNVSEKHEDPSQGPPIISI